MKIISKLTRFIETYLQNVFQTNYNELQRIINIKTKKNQKKTKKKSKEKKNQATSKTSKTNGRNLPS